MRVLTNIGGVLKYCSNIMFVYKCILFEAYTSLVFFFLNMMVVRKNCINSLLMCNTSGYDAVRDKYTKIIRLI